MLLLSALVLPGTPHPFAAKGTYIADVALSADDLQQGALGGHGGDNQEPSAASSEPIPGAPAPDAAFFSIPAPAPEFAHTVSQARAPPLP